MDRRTFLGLVGYASATTAGCVGERSASSGGSDGTAPPTAADEPDRETAAGAATTDGTGGESPPVHQGYDTTEVRVVSPDGDRLGTVTAAIADTPELRYLGLSDTPSLPEDRGMLFVYESVRELTYVMRGMEFAIDIVFADAEGVITRIHHARPPGPGEDGEDLRYAGRGQYVLEVNRHWTTDRGVDEGDVLSFTLPE